jgi:hypothetical protein
MGATHDEIDSLRVAQLALEERDALEKSVPQTITIGPRTSTRRARLDQRAFTYVLRRFCAAIPSGCREMRTGRWGSHETRRALPVMP